MPQAHFICRNGAHIEVVQMPNYTSGIWDISENDASLLVGGMIYFHESKEQVSYFGGRVTGYTLVEVHKGKRPRIVFELTALREARGQSWTGKDHSMAHYSGICWE